MSLKSYSKKISLLNISMLSLGSLFSVVSCGLLILGVDYVSALKLHLAIVLIVAVVAVIASVFVMPLIYALINGSTAISTGRYHIPLIISGLSVSLSNVLLFNLFSMSAVLVAVCLFILVFALSLSMQVYFYVYFSIGTRMLDRPILPKLSFIFLSLSVLVLLVLYMFFYNNSLAIVLKFSYVISTMSVIVTLIVYLSTYSSMPYFIRIEPSSSYTVKENYTRFTKPICVLKSRQMLIARALYVGAVVAGALSIFQLCRLIGVNNYYIGGATIACLSAMIIGCGACFNLFRRKVKAIYKSAVFFSVMLAAAFALMVLPAVIKVNLNIKGIMLILGGFFVGAAASGLFVTNTVRKKICEFSGNSKASVYSLTNCFSVLGACIGAALIMGAILVSRIVTTAYLYIVYLGVGAACTALVICAAIVYYLALKINRAVLPKTHTKPGAPLPILQPENDDAPLTMETVDNLLISKQYEDV